MSDLNQWSTFSYFLLYQLIVIWRFILLRGVFWDRWILNLSLIKLCDLEVMYGVNIVLSPFLFDSQSNFVKGNSNRALHPASKFPIYCCWNFLIHSRALKTQNTVSKYFQMQCHVTLVIESHYQSTLTTTPHSIITSIHTRLCNPCNLNYSTKIAGSKSTLSSWKRLIATAVCNFLWITES